MMADSWKALFRVAPLAALVTIGACSDDPSGPSSNDPFDPEQSSEEFAAVGAAFAANADVLEDLGHVATAVAGFPAATVVLETGAATVGSPLVEPVAAPALRSLIGGSAQPLLPADLLGVTFEWDAEAEEYVQTDRPGAPADGVRFIVYDRTQVPPVENGYLDLTDESDASADRLAVLLVKDDVTRLDYEVAITQGTAAVSLTVDGYVTDGTDRIDFDLDEEITESTNGFVIDVHYLVSLAGQPLSVELDYVVDFGATALTEALVATFVNGANTLVLDLALTSTDTGVEVDGTVEWNGDLVMTVTGSETGQVVFLGPEGEELTPAEAEAIEQMFEIATEGLQLLEAYLAFLGGGLA